MKKQIAVALLALSCIASLAGDIEKTYMVYGYKKEPVTFTARMLYDDSPSFTSPISVTPSTITLSPGETNYFILKLNTDVNGTYMNTLFVNGWSKPKTNLVIGVVSNLFGRFYFKVVK